MHIHTESYDELTPIDEKIELLHDFGVLGENATKQEKDVRKILATCKNDIQMEQKLYNVLHGKETIKDLIARERMSLVR